MVPIEDLHRQKSAGNQLLHYLQQLPFLEPLQKMQWLAHATTVMESMTVQIPVKHESLRGKNHKNDLLGKLPPR